MRLGLGQSLRASTLLGTSTPNESPYDITVITNANGTTVNHDITSIPVEWQYNKGSTAVSVFIGDKVTTVGDLAFSGVSGITSITTTGNSVLSSLGIYAFESTSITNFIIRNSVTSIGDGAFNSCSALTSVTIGSGVTNIGIYGFGFCSGLTSVTIPDNVISIGSYAFQSCTALNNLNCYVSKTILNDSVNGLLNTASPFTIHAKSGDTSWATGSTTVAGKTVTVIKDLA
jgi:hypothetical protein